MDILGIFAAICSTSASLPQLCSRQPETLQMGSLALRCIGGISWSVYGALKNDYPLMVASAIVAGIEFILCAKRRKALYPPGLHDNSQPPISSRDSFSPRVSEDKSVS